MLFIVEGMVMDVHSFPLRYREYDAVTQYMPLLMVIHLSISVMSIRLRLLHPAKAFLPMLVTEEGMVMLLRFEQQ